MSLRVSLCLKLLQRQSMLAGGESSKPSNCCLSNLPRRLPNVRDQMATHPRAAKR